MSGTMQGEERKSSKGDGRAMVSYKYSLQVQVRARRAAYACASGCAGLRTHASAQVLRAHHLVHYSWSI